MFFFLLAFLLNKNRSQPLNRLQKLKRSPIFIKFLKPFSRDSNRSRPLNRLQSLKRSPIFINFLKPFSRYSNRSNQEVLVNSKWTILKKIFRSIRSYSIELFRFDDDFRRKKYQNLKSRLFLGSNYCKILNFFNKECVIYVIYKV